LHTLIQLYEMKVTSIDYTTNNRVVVTCKSSEKANAKKEIVFYAEKVLVTVSLAVLQSHVINFIPPLPIRQTLAIESLGAGCIEKVHN
jgi:hypothetical protein